MSRYFILSCFFAVIFTAFFLIIYYNPANRIGPENLTRFRELTLTDPLLSSFPVKASDLEEAVRLLETVEQSIIRQGREQKADPQRSQFREFLPMRFLKTLAPVEIAYENFLRDPAADNAVQLLKLQEKSAAAYRDDAQLLASNLRKVIQDSRMPLDLPYGSVTQMTYVTPQLLLDSLALIKKNGDDLLAEINLRRRCLFAGLCPSARKIVWDAPAAADSPLALLPKGDLLPGHTNILEISGPYLVPTVCFGFGPDGQAVNQPLYMVYEKWGKLPPLASAKLGTDTWYTYLDPSGDYSKAPFLKILSEAGVVWEAHRETNPYQCNDLSYLFHLATLHWLKNELVQRGGIFSATGNVPKSPAEIEAAHVEQALMTAALPRYSDMRRLGSLYETILKEDRDLSHEQQAKLRDLTLALKIETADLDRLLNMITGYLIDVDDALRLSPETPGDPVYLFIARMHAGFTFLMHSPSIWRIDDPPTLVLRVAKDTPPNPAIRRFTELVKEFGKNYILGQNELSSRIRTDDTAAAISRSLPWLK